MSSSIPLEKWLVMTLLLAISIFLGLLPYMVVRYTKKSYATSSSADSAKYKLALTVLSCFGAGVLFSTCLLHLLPEVRESFNEIPSVWETLPDSHFPLAELVVISGFCLIYLIEEIAHFIMVDGHHDHHHHINTVARHNSIAHAIPIPNVTGTNLSGRQGNSPSICISSSGDVECAGNHSVNNCMDNECPDDEENFTASLRTFLALIALSFHAIMEGVAIGLQDSTNVWVMFGAIASHKFVISFCMGMELVASLTKPLTYVLSIVFFAVMSPLGIIIGSVIASSEDTTESLSVAVIEGLACGTLLYVVFFEILNRERERKSYSMLNSKAIGFIQFFAMIVGLAAMACLLTFTHGDHHDDHSEEDDGHDHDHSHIY